MSISSSQSPTNSSQSPHCCYFPMWRRSCGADTLTQLPAATHLFAVKRPVRPPLPSLDGTTAHPIPSSLSPSHGSRPERDKVPSVLVVWNEAAASGLLSSGRSMAASAPMSLSHPWREEKHMVQPVLVFLEFLAMYRLPPLVKDMSTC